MRETFKFRFAGVFIMLAVIAVFGALVMLLWNALVPALFGLPELNYLQATGLLLLARILFGGLFGGLGHNLIGSGGRRNSMLGHHHANRLREKWMNMSEDERKEFMEKERGFLRFHNHFHHFFDEEEGQKEEQAKEEKNE